MPLISILLAQGCTNVHTFTFFRQQVCLCHLLQVTTHIKAQLKSALGTDVDVELFKYHGTEAPNGSALLKFSNTDSVTAQKQVQALLAPEQQAKLAIPIQPSARPLADRDAVTAGCPQIYQYVGDMPLGRDTDTREYRARIASQAFCGVTHAAAAHMLYLSLSKVAEIDMMPGTPEYDAWRSLLMAFQIQQRTVRKPDSCSSLTDNENAASAYI